MVTTSLNLASALDENFYAGNYEQSLYVYRAGNTVMLGLSLNTKNLTGNDVVAPAGTIPVKYRPPYDYPFSITARDTALWASATYYSCVVRISVEGAVAIVSGSHKGDIAFINGVVSYIVSS